MLFPNQQKCGSASIFFTVLCKPHIKNHSNMFNFVLQIKFMLLVKFFFGKITLKFTLKSDWLQDAG